MAQAVPPSAFQNAALMLATDQSPIANLGPSFFARFIPYMLATTVAIKLIGGSPQRLIWDQYFAFLRMFIFLRALPTIVTGGRGLLFRALHWTGALHDGGVSDPSFHMAQTDRSRPRAAV